MMKIFHKLFGKTPTLPESASVPDGIVAHVLRGQVLVVVGLREVEIEKAGICIESFLKNNPRRIDPRGYLRFVKITRTQHLFEHLSVFENMYLGNLRLGKGKAKQISECHALLQRFGMDINPLHMIEDYSAEDRRLIELARASLYKPDVLFLWDVLPELGFLATNSFTKIIQALREDGCRIVYLCTHWEETLRIGDYYSILNNGMMTEEIYEAREIRKNPHKILNILSGIDNAEPDDESIRALENIYHSSELFVKDYELGKTLAYLASVINSSMHARCSMIYVQDSDMRKHIFSSDGEGEAVYRFSEGFLKKVADGYDGPQYFFRKDFADQHCFETDNDAETVICMRFTAGNNMVGVTAIIYDRYYVASEKQFLILNTFCNELVLLTETAHLLKQSMLLRESHHRIKNNLQIIVGIIYNQKRYFQKNPQEVDYIAELDSLIARIKNISMIHDMLTRDPSGSGFVSLSSLIREVLHLFNTDNVEIKQNVQNVPIVYKSATSLAMIFNEVISNIFKHAFIGIESPQINIHCTVSDQELALEITDNGRGLPADFDIEQSNGVGMSIIRSLVKGLRGHLQVDGSHGTIVTIRVPNENLLMNSVL